MSPSRKTEENRDEQEYPPEVARGWHARTFHMEGGGRRDRNLRSLHRPSRATSCHRRSSHTSEIRGIMRFLEGREIEWHEVARRSTSVRSSPWEGIMSNTKRENWGSLRKLPSGRWQARYPGPDGTTYTARTDQDRRIFPYLTSSLMGVVSGRVESQ